MEFNVARVTHDVEGVFIVGEIYQAKIQELDFEWKGVDSMEIYLKSERVDMDGIWSTSDFNKEFRICS